ncbi:MAG: hypothetical protein ACREIT_08360 [Tepidisphaeraceae bacterium]
MSQTDLQSGAFLDLLTDALRAGPGTPEWRQAVQAVKAAHGNGSVADEYEMLLAAREHLESGREYRAVRPGPGFTRKVMAGIEDEEDGPGGRKSRGIPTATIVAVFSALVLVGVLGLVGHFLWRGAKGDAPKPADLGSMYFGTTVSLSTFDADIPTDWREVGLLTVRGLRGGLRPDFAQATTLPTPAPDYIGGGIVSTMPLAADQPVAVEVTVHITRASLDVVPQIFITDDPTFSADRGTSPHELVWLLRGDQEQVVLPDGRVVAASTTSSGGSGNNGTTGDSRPLIVRFLLDRTGAVIDSGSNRVTVGAHQLNPAKPRQIGVRFLARSGATDAGVTFASVRVLRPQP